MQTRDELREGVIRDVLDASASDLRSPGFIREKIFSGDPGSRNYVVASTALQVRLALETISAVQQLNESSTRLQGAANRFSRNAVWLTVFLAILGTIQIAPFVRSLLSG